MQNLGGQIECIMGNWKIENVENENDQSNYQRVKLSAKHFVSVGPQLASKIPHSPVQFSQCLPKSTPSSPFALNPRAYKGEAGGGYHLPLRFFWVLFQDDKTSAPDVFSGCSFIPDVHFETSLVMVSYYGYEIWRHK